LIKSFNCYLPAKVIIIQARGISICILFQSHVEVVFIQVDGIIFVAIRSPNKSNGRGFIVEGRRALEIFTVVFTPSTVGRRLKGENRNEIKKKYLTNKI
jgi:hypothetical protein